MNEKEMVSHIKLLTKIIERQTEYAEQMNRNHTSTSRLLAAITSRLAKLEGFNGKYDE